MSRYEIRKQHVSDRVMQLCPGHSGVLYVVWDTLDGKRVPFGNYSNVNHARARVSRLEMRNPE